MYCPAQQTLSYAMYDDQLAHVSQQRVVERLFKFGKGLVNFLIWLGIYILPIVIVIGAPIFFFVRWLVRRKRRADEKLKQMPPLPTEKK